MGNIWVDKSLTMYLFLKQTVGVTDKVLNYYSRNSDVWGVETLFRTLFMQASNGRSLIKVYVKPLVNEMAMLRQGWNWSPPIFCV